MSKATLLASIFIIVASCSLPLPKVMAHAPLIPGDNESLVAAAEIPGPLKRARKKAKKP